MTRSAIVSRTIPFLDKNESLVENASVSSPSDRLLMDVGFVIAHPRRHTDELHDTL